MRNTPNTSIESRGLRRPETPGARWCLFLDAGTLLDESTPGPLVNRFDRLALAIGAVDTGEKRLAGPRDARAWLESLPAA